MNDYQLAILHTFLAWACYLVAGSRKQEGRDDTFMIVCVYVNLFLLVLAVSRW